MTHIADPSWSASDPTLVPHRRPGWDDYFLGIAEAVAARGECVRSKVGAVIVRDNRILATGYNGVAAGEPSCLDGICPRAQNQVERGTRYDDPQGACIADHAEDNALSDAMQRLIPIIGSTVYVTKEPCERCAELLELYDTLVVWQDKSKGTSGRADFRC